MSFSHTHIHTHFPNHRRADIQTLTLHRTHTYSIHRRINLWTHSICETICHSCENNKSMMVAVHKSALNKGVFWFSHTQNTNTKPPFQCLTAWGFDCFDTVTATSKSSVWETDTHSVVRIFQEFSMSGKWVMVETNQTGHGLQIFTYLLLILTNNAHLSLKCATVPLILKIEVTQHIISLCVFSLKMLLMPQQWLVLHLPAINRFSGNMMFESLRSIATHQGW